MRATVPAGLNRKEAEVFSRLDPERLPHHVAIIMDGNGRWAKRRHLPRIAGHRAGVAAVRSTIETAARIGIPALTLYSFSAENWKRPKSEVSYLMNLLRRYLMMELPTMMENNIRLQYIGRQHELPQEVQERMSWARESTEKNTGMVLTLALNYGARTEMVDCFNALAREATRNGGLDHLKVDEKAIARHLYTRGLPELDLLIRTSGEMRLEQFPAVAGGLRRDFRDGHAVAGFSRRGVAGSHRGFPETRAPLWRTNRRRTLLVKRVLTAAILIPLVVIALFKAPLWLFTLLVFAVAVLAAHEYLDIVKAQGYSPFQISSYILLGLSFAIFYTMAVLLSMIRYNQTLGAPIGMFLFWGLPTRYSAGSPISSDPRLEERTTFAGTTRRSNLIHVASLCRIHVGNACNLAVPGERRRLPAVPDVAGMVRRRRGVLRWQSRGET